MAVDETALASRYELTTYRVLSSTQISARTAAIASKLTPQDDNTRADKPSLIALTADAKTSSKLVSIAEIAKRELAAAGRKCFQYNVLSSKMIEIERLHQPGPEAEIESMQSDVERDQRFQNMGAHMEPATKKRNVPVLTVYLSTTSAKELKAAVGKIEDAEMGIIMLIYDK